jgi:hypothetical protein
MAVIMNLRAAVKDQFKATHGASLSPRPFIARAVTMTVLRHPAVRNSSMNLDAGTATFHRFINLGMAVDTDRGLPVPNIKNVEDLTVAGLAKQIVDIARRTRGKKIQPDEITVRDHGSGRLRHRDPPGVVSDAYGDSIAAIRRGVTFAVVEEAEEARELGGPRGVAVW